MLVFDCRANNEHGADYLLIGGYALAAHGHQRATTDVDMLIPASIEGGQRVKDALTVLPDQATRDIDLAWFDEGGNVRIRIADAFVVDLMFNANGQTCETLREYAETVYLDGVPVRTIRLQGLLLTTCHREIATQ